jgi:hypothetical protein
MKTASSERSFGVRYAGATHACHHATQRSFRPSISKSPRKTKSIAASVDAAIRFGPTFARFGAKFSKGRVITRVGLFIAAQRLVSHYLLRVQGTDDSLTTKLYPILIATYSAWAYIDVLTLVEGVCASTRS